MPNLCVFKLACTTCTFCINGHTSRSSSADDFKVKDVRLHPFNTCNRQSATLTLCLSLSWQRLRTAWMKLACPFLAFPQQAIFQFPSLHQFPLPFFLQQYTKWSQAKLNLIWIHLRPFAFTYFLASIAVHKRESVGRRENYLEASSVSTHTCLIPNTALQSTTPTLSQSLGI